MADQDGNSIPEIKSGVSGSSNAVDEPVAKSSSLAIRETSDRTPILSSEPSLMEASQDSNNTEGLKQEERKTNSELEENSAKPQELEPFHWEDFEARYDEAMSQANKTEATLLKEFHDMARYFSIWAVSASQNDDDRALKRLKTREAYIQQAERSLEEKRKHYVQVVEAFKKALELLTGP